KANWTDENVNAAQVTARYTMPYSFARVIGFDEIPITTRAIAAVGYKQGVSCIKPWASSYESLLESLFDSYGEPMPDPKLYPLSPADILALSTTGAGEIELLLGNSNQWQPGEIGKVNTWDDEYDPSQPP